MDAVALQTKNADLRKAMSEQDDLLRLKLKEITALELQLAEASSMWHAAARDGQDLRKQILDLEARHRLSLTLPALALPLHVVQAPVQLLQMLHLALEHPHIPPLHELVALVQLLLERVRVDELLHAVGLHLLELLLEPCEVRRKLSVF